MAPLGATDIVLNTGRTTIATAKPNKDARTSSNAFRAVGEALVVAVVVALAVEPRLLRYFGNEIVSQTFWNAFYSRAPEAYKEAIKELAGADKFAEHARWKVSLDWANEGKKRHQPHSRLHKLSEEL